MAGAGGTSPVGDDAAASAIVAKKDLSPHSAAKTSANVDRNKPAASTKGRQRQHT